MPRILGSATLAVRLPDLPLLTSVKGIALMNKETNRNRHHRLQFLSVSLPVVASLLFVPPATAVQFTTLDPAYTQTIYAGPNVGLPGAWMPTGEMLARKGNAPDILEYNTTQNATYQGTSTHGVNATHTISGLAAGNNLARAINGFLYLPTQVGLQRVDSSNWALPAVTVTTVAGPGYGVNSLPNGNVVYSAGFSGPQSNEIHIYNPSSNTDTLAYTSTGLIDDIETSLTGLIALAGQSNNEIILLNSSGGFIQQIPTSNFPDGLAFATTASPPALYSNDNKGTITRYDFGGGYSSPPTNVQTIASGGSYGDIACTGMCKFYVTQFFNQGIHGSALFGTHWDNGVTNNDPSIIEIGSKQGCLFDPPVGFNVNVPEPASLVLVLWSMAAMMCRRSRASV